MSRRPKDLGTDAERAVVRFLQANGFPQAERRALRGISDAGDIAGTPGLAWEVKGGDAARNASDRDIAAWLEETERERVNANAHVGFLVVQRRRVGPANAGRWWAWVRSRALAELVVPGSNPYLEAPDVPTRVLLADAVRLVRWAGWGDPLDAGEVL
jgi:hypothetical protein